MDTVDPQTAVLRCWEHEDCREHPDLGLACASAAERITFLQMGPWFGEPFGPVVEDDPARGQISMRTPLAWGDDFEMNLTWGDGDGHGVPRGAEDRPDWIFGIQDEWFSL